MSQDTRFIRLEQNRPDGTGLAELTRDPADFQSPVPSQNRHVRFKDTGEGVCDDVRDTGERMRT